MCIRDSTDLNQNAMSTYEMIQAEGIEKGAELKEREFIKNCLLYTSDAADERSSVDLGGRRIIKKKKIKL